MTKGLLFAALVLCLAAVSGGADQAYDSSSRRLGRSLLGNSDFQWAYTVGGPGTGDDQYDSPRGMAIDAAGNILVADTGSDRVKKLTSNGTYLANFGTSGTGNGQLDHPSDVKVNPAGNIYVADLFNNRVQVFDSSFNYLFQFGSPGTGNGQFKGPVALCLDGSSNVYVVDRSLQTVQKFDQSGNFVWSSGSSGTGDGQFAFPYACAVSGATVYVGDSTARVQLPLHRQRRIPEQVHFPASSPGSAFFGTSYLLFADDGSLFASRLLEGAVHQLAADGTPLASFTGQPAGFAPVDIAVTQYTGGVPSVVAVVDYSNNAVQFFRRTIFPSPPAPPSPSPPPPSPSPPPPSPSPPPPSLSPAALTLPPATFAIAAAALTLSPTTFAIAAAALALSPATFVIAAAALTLSPAAEPLPSAALSITSAPKPFATTALALSPAAATSLAATATFTEA
ncbi:hypothetical protein ABPG75_008332 [Micractinium tetrahymenae]